MKLFPLNLTGLKIDFHNSFISIKSQKVNLLSHYKKKTFYVLFNINFYILTI